jgi:hypothetical protein
MRILIATIVILFTFIFNSKASQIISSSAEYENDRFIIKISAVVQAKPKDVFKLLTDYPNLTKISPKIIESKIIKTGSEATIVKTIAKGCVWFFCREVINTQITTFVINKSIQSTTIPDQSDLEFGKMLWDVKKVGDNTQIDYYAELDPKFFVPPLIGSYFVKKSMLKEAEAFVDSIEKLSNKKGGFFKKKPPSLFKNNKKLETSHSTHSTRHSSNWSTTTSIFIFNFNNCSLSCNEQ